MTVECVVIGGSAGSTPVLRTVLAALRAPLRVPIIVVTHRYASASQILAEIFGASCELEVTEVEDGDVITPGQVHLAPGGYHLLIGDDGFVLTLEPPENFSIPSIDVVFETAAEHYGPGVLAIALSCASTDGAEGAATVARAGGLIAIQAPATVTHISLVGAVQKRVTPDYVVTPEEIGELINELGS